MLITDSPVSSAIIGKRHASAIAIDRSHSYPEWRSVFDLDPDASPFQHPDYVFAELDRGVPCEKLSPVLLQLGTGEECTGVGVLLPKTVRTGQVGGIGPGWNMLGLRLSGGSFLTIDESMDSQSALLSIAVRHCMSVGADFLLIEDLDEQSSLYRVVQHERTHDYRLFAARDIQPRWRIELPAIEEDYWKTFSSRTRRAFRTRLKKFGQTRLERVTEVEQIPEFLNAAYEISKQSWQSRQFGLRIRNDEFELQQLSVLARHGFLRSYLWRVEEKPVAFALCHQHGGDFRYEEIAFCAEFSPLSPGETMLQQIVEDLYRHKPPKCFDFGGGDAEYKRRFGNRESRSQTVWLVPPTWRARSSLAYLNGCRGLRSIARRIVKTCGLATKARQWLRYGGRSDHAKAVAPEASNPENETVSPERSGR